jgi:hypothetical protein
MLHNKNLSIATPFNHIVKKFILIVAYIAIGIGFFSNYGVDYAEWLSQQGVKLPTIQLLKFGIKQIIHNLIILINTLMMI